MSIPVSCCDNKPRRKNSPSYEHLLGKVPDSLIAEVYGLDNSSVSQLRRHRGIEAIERSEAMYVADCLKNYTLEEKRAFIEECIA